MKRFEIGGQEEESIYTDSLYEALIRFKECKFDNAFLLDRQAKAGATEMWLKRLDGKVISSTRKGDKK